MEWILAILTVFALITLYFLPIIIAYRKNLKSKALIAVITILLWRTGLVWLGTLLYALLEESNNLHGKKI